MASKTAANVATAIKANNKNLMADLARGDAAAIGTRYAKGAKLMPPNADFQKGKHIAHFWQGAIDRGIKSGALKTQEVEVHGATAIEVGTYVLKGAGKTRLDTGKYIVVWKKEGRDWKLYRDIFNSSQPAG